MRKKHLLFLSLIAAGVAGCNQHSANPAAKSPGEIGSKLPDFSVADLQGRRVTTSALRGKVVLIDFWGTWCAPCKTEMPGYQMLMDRYGSRGFAVIGLKVDVMQDTEDPLEFAKRIGAHYPLVVAGYDLRQKFGGIVGLPTTMVYDRAGILRKKVIGFEYTSVIEEELKSLL